jgi:hypothetical protein
MFNEKDIINFACNKCGKCCVQTPNMTFIDMLELSKEFIFQTYHNVAISYADSGLDKKQIDYYKMIAHTIMIPEIEASMFYYVDFSVLPLQTSTTCEKLVNNECSIYINRPNSCKLLPINNKYDEGLQWKTINFFKKKSDEKEWACDFSTNATVLYKDGEIYNPTYKSLYNIEMENIRDFTDKYMLLIDMFGSEKKNSHMKRLFNCVKNSQSLVSDVVLSLQTAIFNSLISSEKAESFIEDQINLLKKNIEICIQNKDKNNLQVHRVYKKILSDYEDILSKRILQNDISLYFNS